MCTAVRFADRNGALFFGRNLDWMESYGEEILATPRGFAYDYALGATHAEQPHAVLGVGCVMGANRCTSIAPTTRASPWRALIFRAAERFLTSPSKGHAT